MEAIEQGFREAFPDWDRIDPRARGGMLAHAVQVLAAGQRCNLTGLRDPARLAADLFAPSWRVGEIWDLSGRRVLDLGSGGGFPGIPLALRFPSASFTLCDSIGKKAAFLKEAIRAVPVPNAEVFSGRAEELLRRERFDAVIAQAVSPTHKLLSLLAPARKSFQQIGLMKGKNWDKESDLDGERALGFAREKVLPIPSTRGQDARYLLLFRPLDG